MSVPSLDRRRLVFRPLADRRNRVLIERDRVDPDAPVPPLPAGAEEGVEACALRIGAARRAGRPVILAFGAHAIKNGLGPVLIRLVERGWVTHLATNGAGIIHDWEFAFQGMSSEDVKANVESGEFGMWEETGRWINLALLVGAHAGLGYGECVGALIEREGLDIPAEADLAAAVRAGAEGDTARAASAADLLGAVRAFGLTAGFQPVPHPFKAGSVQAAAFRLGVPFTGHPMFGHDIIYNHPLNHGAAVGRTALRDYLRFADAVSRLSGGVYLSVGSAVMSPMIFEKAMAMAQNLARQSGGRVEGHSIAVVDLAEAAWDWSRGEPPESHPAYYLRYCKTFSRMGGEMRYTACDNRLFLPALCRRLERGA